jgi:hypothetical protein
VTSPNVSRGASIRSNTLGVKPVTVTKAVSETKTDSSGADAATSRLSVGKYLHNKGVVSGVIPAANTVPTSQSEEFIDLTDRVVSLENKIEGKQDVLSGENVVSSGEGPLVSEVTADNGTITVTKTDITIPVGAVNSETRAQIWVQ